MISLRISELSDRYFTNSWTALGETFARLVIACVVTASVGLEQGREGPTYRLQGETFAAKMDRDWGYEQ